MLDGLQGNVEHPNSQAMRNEIIGVIEGSIAGGHSESTLELLMYWVFDASEHQKDITKLGLLAQIESIGEYLAALRDNSIEWGVSVCPVRNEVLSDDEIARLVKEYQLGIQACWKHILADADCPRTKRLSEIHDKLGKKSAVIVRGASGQGKSTLGWRYLHEYCVEGSRFHVKIVEDREHAMRIANAIESHVRKLRLDVVVYVDVAPNDSGWEELVRGLTIAGLKVLVTVREEDFRRTLIDVSKFDYAEVVLDGITLEEAEPIYESLRAVGETDVLNFEDVWGQFTANGDGPLMEFTHLITQGQTLESKIESQVARLRRDASSDQGLVNNQHLHLLAIAALANSAEARVGYHALCEEVGLDPISKPLEVLEQEYLLPIRIDGNQTLVGGLHALRSLALERALVPDEQWVDFADRALAVVADGDIERFLLCVFSRRQNECATIEKSVRGLTLRSWTQAGGICKALIWLGINRYEQANSEVIHKAIDQYGDPWLFCCDVWVGFEGDSFHEQQREGLDPSGMGIPRIPLTAKTDVFVPLIGWATEVEPPPNPSSSADWRGAGDTAYWLGRHHVTGPLRDIFASLLPDEFEKSVSLESIAAFVSGLSKLDQEGFEEWHGRISVDLKERFNAHSDSICVVENGEQVKVYFAVALRDEASNSTEVLNQKKSRGKINDWHSQAMVRISLLRDLLPAKSFYASQGIGLEPFAPILDHDPTFKRIPVEDSPENRAVHLNAVFIGLVNYRHNRLDEWREYSAKAMEYRKAVRTIFRKLNRTLGDLLSAPTVKQSVLRRFPQADVSSFVSKLPMLPKKAVDEWGFASEGRNGESSEENSEAILRRFEKWREASNQYARGIGNVMERIIRLTNKIVGFKTGNPIEDAERDSHLIVVNLAESWKALKLMQREFRVHFGQFYSRTALREIEEHEQINFRHLWSNAIASRHGMNKSGKTVESEISQFRSQFLKQLHEEVATTMEGVGSVEIVTAPWTIDDVDHLRVVCNHDTIETIDLTTKEILEAIWRAFHFRKWEDFEWMSIAVEWQKLAVVHQVRGRCLSATLNALHTDTLFFASAKLEVKDYHRALLPIDKDSFLSGGFTLWDTPLLNTTFAFNEQMLLLVVIMTRLAPLMEVLNIEPNDATNEIVMTSFANELDSATLMARQAKTDLERLLQMDANNNTNRMAAVLNRICDVRLEDFDMSGFIGLLDRLNQWWQEIEDTEDEFGELILELMEYSIQSN
jgi:hypothetical protein